MDVHWGALDFVRVGFDKAGVMRLIHFRVGMTAAFLWLGVNGVRAEDAPPPMETAKLVSTGNLFDDKIVCEFAIYLLPDSKDKPEAVLAALLAKQGDYWKMADKKSSETSVPTVVAHLITDVQKSYAPPDLHALQYFGRGLTKEQADQLQTCQQAYIMDFVFPSKDVWKSLRSATELAGDMGAGTGGLVWDEGTREVFTPDAWTKKRLVDWPVDTVPDIAREVTMHAYKDGDFVRAITLGMSKCGLPDIVVNDFVWSQSRSVGNLINLLAQALAEGATLTSPGEFDLKIGNIKNEKVREETQKSLLDHATSTAKLGLRMAKLEDGDAPNRLIEITFDGNEGADNHARQDKLLSSLFGWHDEIKSIKNNEELLATSQRAKDKLPALQAAFQKGLAPGEFISVKAPFATAKNGTEWMWVEVSSWKGDAIRGMLKNEPFYIPTMHGGQMVDVSQKDVFDYIHTFPDGHQEGNETSAIIEKMDGVSQ